MVGTEQRAFLDAIIENPQDDTLRVVYADYLEENGDGARAEFIRLQCFEFERKAVWVIDNKLGTDLNIEFNESASDHSCYTIRPGRVGLGTPRLSPGDYIQFSNDGVRWGRMVGAVKIGPNPELDEIDFGLPEDLPKRTGTPDELAKARDTASRLYRDHRLQWFGEFTRLQPSWVDDSVRRGFVEQWSGSLADWMRHGPDIARDNPVRPHEEMITNREPELDHQRDGTKYRWVREDDYRRPYSMGLPVFCLPNRFFDGQKRSVRFKTRGEAKLWLATRCIEMARQAQPAVC